MKIVKIQNAECSNIQKELNQKYALCNYCEIVGVKVKFKIDDTVTVIKKEDVDETEEQKYVGNNGKIVKIDLLNEPWIYKVEFFNEEIRRDWFSEYELM